MDMISTKRAMHYSKRAKKALLIKAGPGTGKSEGTEQYAETIAQEHGECFLSVLNAATANLGNVAGFLIPVKDEKLGITKTGFAKMRGEFTYPHFFIDRKTGRPADTFKHGIVVIEEWGQGSPEVRRALATLIHEYRMGEYVLPPDFQIIILSNRAIDRSGVSGKEFMFLVNRWTQVELVTTLEDWMGYALEHGVSELAMAFAVQNTESVWGTKMPEKDEPWLTLRSLVGADRILAEAFDDGADVKDPLLVEMLEGTIGQGATAQLMAFARLRDQLPTYDEILSRPGTARTPKDNAPDALMLTSYMLASKVEKDTLKPIMAYMMRVPEAFGVTFVKAALKRRPALIHTKDMGDYCLKNSVIIGAVTR